MQTLILAGEKPVLQDISSEEFTESIEAVVQESMQRFVDRGTEIPVGFAAACVHSHKVAHILIAPRYDGDGGFEFVEGWTLFCFWDRQTKEVQITRYHDMAMRCLINDFYHDFATSDNDMSRLKRSMANVWRQVVETPPKSARKPDHFDFLDDLSAALSHEGFMEQMIDATEYMAKNDSTKEVRDVMDLSKPRFVMNVRDIKYNRNYIVFLTTLENQNPIAIVRFVAGEVVGACFLKMSFGAERLRNFFFWITSTDLEYRLMERAILRAVRQLEEAPAPR